MLVAYFTKLDFNHLVDWDYSETKAKVLVVVYDPNVRHLEMHSKHDLRSEEVVTSMNLGEKHLVLGSVYEKRIWVH